MSFRFQFPDPVLVPPPEGNPIRYDIEEPLTGLVSGKDASDLEENVAWAHDVLKRPYYFKYNVDLLGLSDNRREIDFLGLSWPWYLPIEVDGDIAHSTEAQLGADELRDALIEAELRQHGFLPIIRLKESTVDTKQKALETVREIYQ